MNSSGRPHLVVRAAASLGVASLGLVARIVSIAVVGALALATPGVAEPTSPAQRLLERVVDAYGSAEVFEESGPILVLAGEPGIQPRRWGFTASLSEGGYEIEVATGSRRDILWRDAQGRYWRRDDNVLSGVSEVEDAVRSLPDGVLVAVPSIALRLGVGLEVDADSLTLGGEGDCEGRPCDRLLGRANGMNFRWWIDRADGRLWKSEVEVASTEGDRLLQVDLRTGPIEPSAEELADDLVFGEVVDVELASAIVRVGKAGGGNPIPGLGPEHFFVQVDGRRAKIEAVDFVTGGSTAHFAPAPKDVVARPRFVEDYPPRLVTFFFQSDLTHSRLVGQTKFRGEVHQLLAALHDRDWGAVVSFDSRFRLRQDFTRDRELLAEAAAQAIFRSKSKSLGSISPIGPSLLRDVDEKAARKISNSAQAIEQIADSMAGWEGEKILVFVGYGLGDRYYDLERMRNAVDRAEVTVWVLDITEAKYHGLETGLRQIALDSGGTYQKTYLLPGDSARRLANRLSAYYVVYFVRPDLPRGRLYPISVKLDADAVENSWIIQQTQEIR